MFDQSDMDEDYIVAMLHDEETCVFAQIDSSIASLFPGAVTSLGVLLHYLLTYSRHYPYQQKQARP